MTREQQIQFSIVRLIVIELKAPLQLTEHARVVVKGSLRHYGAWNSSLVTS